MPNGAAMTKNFRRTTFSLNDETLKQLEDLRVAEKMPVSAIVRAAVSMFYGYRNIQPLGAVSPAQAVPEAPTEPLNP